MFSENIESISVAAKEKVVFMENNLLKFIVLSIFAGIFIGFGVMLVFSIAAPLAAAGSPFVKLIMGASFAVALSLVIFAGSELFTGNNLITVVGKLEGRIKLKKLLKLWFWCFLGNLLGSILFAWLVYKSGLISSAPTADFILQTSSAKMGAPIVELFFRGILCNMLVTLAIWMSFKADNEVAKLILIFWCLFAFIGSGFEHSIANMSLLAMGLFVPHPDTITIMGYIRNLVPVTLGNIVGGSFIIAYFYWYVSKDSAGKKVDSTSGLDSSMEKVSN